MNKYLKVRIRHCYSLAIQKAEAHKIFLAGRKPSRIREDCSQHPKLQQELGQLSHLPKPKQDFVTEMLDAVLQQQAQGR